MSIMSVIRSVVQTVDTLGENQGLKCRVRYKRFITEPGEGNGTYANTILLSAFVDWKSTQVRDKDGVLTKSRCYIAFTNKVALMKATNKQGIGDNDKIILPDGTTGPILDMSGYIDPGDGLPVATEVWMG